MARSLCLDGRLWVIYRLRGLQDENEVDAWAADAWICLFGARRVRYFHRYLESCLLQIIIYDQYGQV